MKVKNIFATAINTTLTEDLDFNDLKSLHIAALRAIDEDRMDVYDASDRMMDILYELQSNDLIDDNYQLTELGAKALAMAKSLGGSKERRRAAAMKDVKIDDIYDDDYADNSIDDESPYQTNKHGTANQMY